jgi:hypothetical protein
MCRRYPIGTLAKVQQTSRSEHMKASKAAIRAEGLARTCGISYIVRVCAYGKGTGTLYMFWTREPSCQYTLLMLTTCIHTI